MIKNEPAYTLLSGKETDNGKWQQLLDRSSTASYFQTPECFRFYASLSFLRPFVYAIEENGEYRALVCGYCISDGRGIKKYMSRRAIIPGGALIAGDCQEEALTRLLNHVKESLHHRAIYIEFRNYTGYDKQKATFEQCGFRYHPHLNFHIKTTDPAQATKQLSSTKRRDIKLSLKEGAVIERSSSAEDIRALYAILEDLYQTKIKTPLFPFEFFDTLSKQPGSHFFLVKYNGKVIGGSVCVALPSKKLYEWFVCGQDNSYKNIYPSTLATWAAIEYAAGNNFAVFDMMGAGKPGEGYGVRDFKARFGGELVEHGRFITINKKTEYAIASRYIHLKKHSKQKNEPAKKTKPNLYIETDITKINIQEWRDFNRTHPKGNIFQSPDMYEITDQTPGLQPFVFAAVENARLSGILLVQVQKQHSGVFGIFSARAIISGGPVVANDSEKITALLLEALDKQLSGKVIYTQFRNMYNILSLNDVFQQYGYHFESHLNILIRLTGGKEQLWKNISDSRRKKINSAIKYGFTSRVLTENIDNSTIESCYQIISAIYKNAELPLTDIGMLKKAAENNNLILILIKLNNDIVGCRFILKFEKYLYGWYAGSKSSYYSHFPNDLLIWETLRWSSENSFDIFDYGGAGSPNTTYGVRKFKLQSGGELVNLGRYNKQNKPVLFILAKVGFKLWKIVNRRKKELSV